MGDEDAQDEEMEIRRMHELVEQPRQLQVVRRVRQRTRVRRRKPRLARISTNFFGRPRWTWKMWRTCICGTSTTRETRLPHSLYPALSLILRRASAAPRS